MSAYKKICIFMAFTILFTIAPVNISSAPEISVSAQSAILIDADRGTVLFSKNPDSLLPMASTTKIMTAVAIIESCDLDAIVNIPLEAVGIEGSSIYLCANERLTVRQLLYALLLSSANDAATALAIFAAGSIEKFAEKMNATAERLGMTNSHFDKKWH